MAAAALAARPPTDAVHDDVVVRAAADVDMPDVIRGPGPPGPVEVHAAPDSARCHHTCR